MAKIIPFTKMEGLGNDYIYIDLVENKELVIEKIIDQIPVMCNRNFGIGSDGVIFVGKENETLYTRIFNCDGSEAGICGNGLRCVARICYDRGYIDTNLFNIFLKDSNKLVEAIVNDDYVTINMGVPELGTMETLCVDNKEIEFVSVDIGNPHAVVFVNDLDDLQLMHFGRSMEFHKRFPNRTNVEFVKVIDNNKIKLRVWERGVGETLACGSGACAAGLLSLTTGFCKDIVTVCMLGGEAKIQINNNKEILLTGSANYVFDGTYYRKTDLNFVD